MSNGLGVLDTARCGSSGSRRRAWLPRPLPTPPAPGATGGRPSPAPRSITTALWPTPVASPERPRTVPRRVSTRSSNQPGARPTGLPRFSRRFGRTPAPPGKSSTLDAIADLLPRSASQGRGRPQTGPRSERDRRSMNVKKNLGEHAHETSPGRRIDRGDHAPVALVGLAAACLPNLGTLGWTRLPSCPLNRNGPGTAPGTHPAEVRVRSLLQAVGIGDAFRRISMPFRDRSGSGSIAR